MNKNADHFQVLDMVIKKHRAKTFLEVGVQEGHTLRTAVKTGLLTELTLCDTWGPSFGGTNRGSNAHIEKLLDELGYAGTRTYLEGRSQDLLPKVTTPFDVVHIDGDHSFQGALQDLMNGWRLTRYAMVVHDLAFPEVSRAFHVFLSTTPNGQGSFEIFEGGYWTAVVTRPSVQ